MSTSLGVQFMYTLQVPSEDMKLIGFALAGSLTKEEKLKARLLNLRLCKQRRAFLEQAIRAADSATLNAVRLSEEPIILNDWLQAQYYPKDDCFLVEVFATPDGYRGPAVEGRHSKYFDTIEGVMAAAEYFEKFHCFPDV